MSQPFEQRLEKAITIAQCALAKQRYHQYRIEVAGKYCFVDSGAELDITIRRLMDGARGRVQPSKVKGVKNE